VPTTTSIGHRSVLASRFLALITLVIGAGYQAGINLASGMTFSYLAVKHMQQG
jgi:hypothetical protein